MRRGRTEILVAAGLALYVTGTLGYLVFGTTFFVALAFIVACALACVRASTISHKRRMARERRHRRGQRIAAHDAFWLEDQRAA